MLSWILPLTAIIGYLVDTILVVVFMRLAHPWKEILFGQIIGEGNEKTIEVEQVGDKNDKTIVMEHQGEEMDC